MNGLPNVEHSYGAELVRKAIHLCSLSIPVIYFFITKTTALSILIPLTLAFAVVDVVRLLHPPTRELFHRWFGWLLRAHERDHETRRLNGATYVLLSACLCIWLFPKVIVVTAFAILIISDTSAALVGRKFGRRRFVNNKTLEGTAAFLVSALIVVAVAPKVAYLPGEYIIGAAGALVGALVEALPVAVDDNLSIPLAVGAAMWGLYLLLLPTVNVFALDVIR